MRISWKRIISTALVGCLSLTTLAVFPTFAEDEAEKYPYMMFASSNNENAIDIIASNVTTNGKIITNGNVSIQASNNHLNGDVIENADEDMVYIGDGLRSTYFSFDEADINTDSYIINQSNLTIKESIHAENDIDITASNLNINEFFSAEESVSIDASNVNINKPFVSNGSMDITASNIKLNESFMAHDDINLDGSCENYKGVVLYSEYGDININTSNANFTGLIYAPYGDVNIEASNSNSNINGIIIANNISVSGSNVNINYRQSIGEIVANTPKDNDFTHIPSDATIELTASNEDIIIGEDSNQVYFYADFYYETEKLELVNAENDTVVGTLYDDGDYFTHGDDLQGDGIYSCIYNVDTSNMENIIRNTDFYVQYIDENGNTIKSNTLMIAVYRDFTETELLEIDAVDNAIFGWLNTDEYSSMSLEERKEFAYQMLVDLATNGTLEFPYSLVDINSIYYSESDNTYQFDYICGIPSGITLVSYNSDECGGSLSAVEDSSTVNPSFFCSNSSVNNSVSLQNEQIQEIGQTYQINNNVLILNSFEEEREPFYNDFQNRLINDVGLNVTLNSNVLLSDYKNMNNSYGLIILAGHGGIKETPTSTGAKGTYIVLLDDKSISASKYMVEINRGEVIVESGTIGEHDYYKACKVFGEFFRREFKNNELYNTIIFAHSCKLFGEKGTFSHYFSNGVLSTGASAFIGYHNTVYQTYGQNMMESFTKSLANGETCISAIEIAKSKFGETDTHDLPAFLHCAGNENANLYQFGNSAQNGSFENGLNLWKSEGDVRVIQRLGNITPTDQKSMAFLSTGIGSKQILYSQTDEGSILRQTFYVPSDATTLSFDYDFISSEPMYWLGSVYDDDFEASLYIQITDETQQIAYESVNNVDNWILCSFLLDQNDPYKTTYHTSWKTKEVDISAYQGQLVSISFCVSDVGDSTIDSAVLIDNIQLN
jgi:hypothetical protein